MTIPEEKLREILALADKATPGRWSLVESDGPGYVGTDWPEIDHPMICEARLCDREYIAACSPDTVKAIVQELLAARAEIARLRENDGDDYCADCNTGLADCCCGVRLG